jgi:hypothetical protein
VLDALEKVDKNVQVLAPAFQWAQSLDNVFINIKYATRFDTPGCLETYDEQITIEERRLNISIFCKHVSHQLNLEMLTLIVGQDNLEVRARFGTIRCS